MDKDNTRPTRPERHPRRLSRTLLVGMLTLSTTALAEVDIKVETVAEGLTHPWGMVFLPSGEVLVSEREGAIRRIVDGELQPEPIDGAPKVHSQGQGGLLDLALHPDFADNRWLYYSYAHANAEGNTTRLSRAKYENGALGEEELLFEATPREGTSHHFAGRIAFDPDGYLYLTVGDRGQMEEAQNLDHHAGSTIRLNADGSVPEDNPFVNQDNAKPEIYTYGNRNAQGMTIHPDTGEVWQHEHGPRGGDEVNVVEAGANYGWPAITYGIDYDGSIISEQTAAEGMKQPLHYWDPSIAPSGMAFYQGDEFPEWQGDLFVGALKMQKLVRLRFDGHELVEEEDLLEDRGERYRDVTIGPDGAIWLLTDSSDGKVLRLTAD